MKNESNESKDATVASSEAASISRSSRPKNAGVKKLARKPRSKRASTTPRGAGSKKAATIAVSKTPVTEKPVLLAAPKKTSQYLVTIDNSTGVAVSIEKIDPGTGKKKELSQAEYLQLVSSNVNPLPVANFQSLGGYSGAPATDNAALTEAYYRGVVDYLNALGLS